MHTSTHAYFDFTSTNNSALFTNYHQQLKRATGLWNAKNNKPNYSGFRVYPLSWWLPSLISRIGITLGFLNKDAYYSKIKNLVVEKLEHAHNSANTSFEEKRNSVSRALYEAKALLEHAKVHYTSADKKHTLTEIQHKKLLAINSELDSYISLLAKSEPDPNLDQDI